MDEKRRLHIVGQGGRPIIRNPRQTTADELQDLSEVRMPRVFRPTVREECVNVPRPCPFVSCEHHLYLDVTPRGGLRLNFPDLDVADMGESCALDVAERGEHTLDEVGELTNVTRERVRQIETTIFEKLRPLLKGVALDQLGRLLNGDVDDEDDEDA